MDNLWISPLLLLPGTALLILSTSVRFARIHEEIHHLLENPGKEKAIRRSHLLRRATLFRNALVWLYLSVCCLAAAGLLGGLTIFWPQTSFRLVTLFTIPGVLSMLAAAAILVRESVLSLDIIREHMQALENE